MATATRTVKIKPETYGKLQRLARETHRSLPDVLEEAIGEYERKKFLEGLHEDFSRLRAQPEEWRAEQEERAPWDNALIDGLENETPYPAEAMRTEQEKTASQAAVNS